MKIIKFIISLFCLVTLLTGCSKLYLEGEVDYLSRAYLASYQIRTPDPRLFAPMIGQRMLVSWGVPDDYLCIEDLYLKVTIRFGDRSQIVREVPIEITRGYYIYKLAGEDFECRKGIQTYKLEIIGNGQILIAWYHQLWVELITVGAKEESEAPIQEDAVPNKDK
jgi:hypothetical protein